MSELKCPEAHQPYSNYQCKYAAGEPTLYQQQYRLGWRLPWRQMQAPTWRGNGSKSAGRLFHPTMTVQSLHGLPSRTNASTALAKDQAIPSAGVVAVTSRG